MKRQNPSAASSPSTTTAENPWRSTTDRRPTCAPIRRGRALPRRASGSPTHAGAHHARTRPVALPHTHRAAAARLGLPHRHLSAGRHVPGQGRRGRGRGILSRHGFTGRIDLLGRSAAPLHAENAHARFLPDPRRRDHAGARHRRGAACRPATPWCSGAPITPGAIARTEPCTIAISSHDAAD